ncbi:small nucleolar ribonucleoprotein IMP3 [Octopus vulgaris]|uniref:Small nucleolar ribonucleoprotein IMP3 n=1 Tax=Octopus vulgaris TaxID=6645 RepID=A0AA36BQN8_OCTVU|nr:small nucleolar ribonucleoprotein IMP3 [Octopus vulgaris]
MVRKLKYHEKKLLKKVDFISWEVDDNLKEVKVMRRFHILKRENFTKYKGLSRDIRELARKIKELDPKDGYRAEATSRLLEKFTTIRMNLLTCPPPAITTIASHCPTVITAATAYTIDQCPYHCLHCSQYT